MQYPPNLDLRSHCSHQHTERQVPSPNECTYEAKGKPSVLSTPSRLCFEAKDDAVLLTQIARLGAVDTCYQD